VLGEKESFFFKISSHVHSTFTVVDPDGTLHWTMQAPGYMCNVQRATTLAGSSNWVDFAQHKALDAYEHLRVFDPATPAGMAYIPAGYFQMGDSFGGEGDYYAELPVHTVYTSALYMDKTEVTWAKWREVYDWSTNRHGYAFDNTGSGMGDTHPVHTVSWYDAVKWCNARSQKEGRTAVYYKNAAMTQVYTNGQVAPYVKWSAKGYRLPTEAEWEKAARGGPSGRRFSWGDLIDHDKANYRGEPEGCPYDMGYEGFDVRFSGDGAPYTSPAGFFPPNDYGVFDMCGNLAEWCWDWYATDYYSMSPEKDPRGPDTGIYRANRCGRWGGGPFYSRLAYRFRQYPYERSGSYGFRTVLLP
jgi:formylglycine-generating enzyme required for sulfatase activity